MPIRYEGPKVIAALSPHIVIPAKAGPTGASVLACAPKSGAKLPISCPGLPCPPSPCSPLSGATDLACTHLIVAVSDQSVAELPLPCPDWPYLPFSALWPTFRAHRPRLRHVAVHSLHTKPPPHFLSFPRNREGKGIHRSFGHRIAYGQWMPAFAGMTMCGDRASGPIYAPPTVASIFVCGSWGPRS